MLSLAAIAPALLADANWFKIIFFLVVFVIWIFNNLLSEKNKKAKQAQQARRAANRADAPRADATEIRRQEGTSVGAGQSQTPQLNSEIEEFLQRANRKRQEKAQRRAAKGSPQPAKVAAPIAEPVRRRLVESLRAKSTSVGGKRPDLTEVKYVAPDLSKYEDSPSRLLDDDFQKDDAERQAHFKEAFQHKLGNLTDTSLGAGEVRATGPQRTGAAPSVAEPTVAAAANITLAALLANPQSLQQAIIVQEILRPPEDRWQ